MNTRLIAAWFAAVALQGCSTSPAPAASPAASRATLPAAAAVAVEMNPKVLISDNNLGNCLACHSVPAHPELVAGNIGPPFIAMKQRFPDAVALRAVIYDEQTRNPDTIMPPFGRNRVLTPAQINAIADYIREF
jgi:sulfur-oxidizing protein SoxX